MTAVEAQAAGRPVIARSAGGALETVVEGVTGCFWDGGPDELAEAVIGFDPGAIDPADCVASAARFDTEVFRRTLPREVEEALAAAPKRERDPRAMRRTPRARLPFSPGVVAPRRPGF